MCKLGFEGRFISIIMDCITFVSNYILINGQPQRSFIPSRGVRQSDPLSPYLFIICVEALTSMLNQAEAIGNISTVPIGEGLLKINNLFLQMIAYYSAKLTLWSGVMSFTYT